MDNMDGETWIKAMWESPRPNNIRQVRPRTGCRFYTAVDVNTQRKVNQSYSTPIHSISAHNNAHDES